MEKRGRLRGQASVEFLTVFAVVLLVFMVFFIITQQQAAALGTDRDRQDAIRLVSTIDSAAKYVYNQGTGAKKQVEIRIPYGYEPDQSYIENNSVKLRVGGNDYAESEPFAVYGSLPRFPGTYTIWIISEQNGVRIGTAMLATDREAINVIMASNDSRTAQITIYNVWNSTIYVTLAKQWDDRVAMSLSQTSFDLSLGASKNVSIAFTSSASTSSGFYIGHIEITGNDSNGKNETKSVPVAVEITMDQGIGPPLMVLPSMLNATMLPNTTIVRAFQVCTNIKTSLTAVAFNPSNGAPGNWVGSINPLSQMGPGECQAKAFIVTAPSDVQNGNYSGYIYVAGTGAQNAEDTVALAIRIGSAQNDSQGPRTNITIFPGRRKFVGDPVAVRATGDDGEYGSNSIKSCEARVDGGQWYQLTPLDGEYNEPAENASYTFYSGFTMGNHTASARCTDSWNNTGPEANATFKVMKEFLFVLGSTVANGNESAWLNYLATKQSDQGYAWNTDTVGSSDFIAGPANLYFYSTVVLAEYVSGENTGLNSFHNSGGSVVVIGNAVTNGVEQLVGCMGNIKDPENQTQVQINDNAHYITSGLSKTDYVVETNMTLHSRFWKNCNINQVLMNSYSDPTHYNEMAIAGKMYFWAPVTPARFNELGQNLTTRILDYAINASTIN